MLERGNARRSSLNENTDEKGPSTGEHWNCYVTWRRKVTRCQREFAAVIIDWVSSHAFISTRLEFPCFHFLLPGGSSHAFSCTRQVGVRMLCSTRWEFACFHFYQVGAREAWTQNSLFKGFLLVKLVLFCSYLTFVFISSDENNKWLCIVSDCRYCGIIPNKRVSAPWFDLWPHVTQFEQRKRMVWLAKHMALFVYYLCQLCSYSCT